MTKHDLSTMLRNNLFASRNTLKEAYDEVIRLAEQCDNPTGVYTVAHILMNTIANQIEVTE